jgi:hypothetical protein
MISETDLAKVADAVAELEAATKPGVLYIRWSLDEDWTGDLSFFFRVVLSDEAAAHLLCEVTQPVMRALGGHALGFEPFGYVNFRSESECKKLNEAEWMPA